MKPCVFCGSTENALQVCIVCERSICQNELAPGLWPGDLVICRECDKITPNREQAEQHFWLRQGLQLEESR